VTAEFDYIIVGAGSAGCALASRLSEDPDVRVLLVEAGNWAKGWLRGMPAAVKQIMKQPAIAWGFESEPEPGLTGRRVALRRGKVIGGCSQINGMVYSRGHPDDYDGWAKLGCTGWNYANVLPYFRRSESSWAGESEIHGSSGPMGVSRPQVPSLMIDIFRDAIANAGYPGNEDYHAEYQEGFVPSELTVARGRRADTGTAYLKPALGRRNLCVLTETHIRRVCIEAGRATSVEYFENGQAQRARAAREVILCAGAYGSPHTLMLSGIGDPDALRSAGIEIVHALPGVGKNLKEHPLFVMQFSAHPKTFMKELRIDRAVISALRWAINGSGPFATNACAGNAYFRSLPGLDRPDIQFNLPALNLGSWLWAPWSPSRLQHGLSILVIGLRQDSVGTVSLRNADPYAPPCIQLNLLQEQSDIDRMRRGIRLAREIYAQPPLREVVIDELWPGRVRSSDADLEAALRERCITAEHPVGTCKMGTDTAAVVDPQLRVIGIEGLRVADASIMPTIVSGNTNAPVIMIAEKAADLIRIDSRRPLGQQHTRPSLR